MLLIGIFIIVLIVRKRGQRKAEYLYRCNQEYLVRQQKAVWASAIVLNIRSGVIGESSSARVELSLEVTPSEGITLLDIVELVGGIIRP